MNDKQIPTGNTPGARAARSAITEIESSGLSEQTRHIVCGYCMPDLAEIAGSLMQHHLQQVPRDEQTAAAVLVGKLFGQVLADGLTAEAQDKTV